MDGIISGRDRGRNRAIVLNCITGLNIGGAEHMLVRFLRHLVGGSFDVSVLSLLRPGPLQRQLVELDVPLASLTMARTIPSLRALRGLRQVFGRVKPELVHGWMYHGNLAASVGSLMGPRQPVIWSVHHSLVDIHNENSMTQALIRLSAALSGSTAAITYCSKASADQHEKLGYDAAKRVIIPNGIDCGHFRPRPGARGRLRAALGIPDCRLIIGNVARAHPMKDHRNLVSACQRLVGQGLDVQLLLVGADHEGGVAVSAADDLGIADRVCLLGPQDDVGEIMAGLDLYVSSSAWGEAFPLTILEAMASGVPSLSTDVGDCAELIGDADLIAPPRDAEALAAALGRVCRLPPEERRALGLRGRARVVDNYSLESYVRTSTALYELVLSEARRPPK